MIAADTRATSGPIVADKVQATDLELAYASDILTRYPRIAKSCIIYHRKYGAQVQAPRQIQNSPPPSSLPI